MLVNSQVNPKQRHNLRTLLSLFSTSWECATQNFQLHFCSVSPRNGCTDKTRTVAIIMGMLRWKGEDVAGSLP